MPVASAILWCEPGQAEEVARRAPGPETGELFAVRDEAVVLILEACDRAGIDRRLAACRQVAGVRWVDGSFYSEEDLDPAAATTTEEDEKP